ncbi:uncharacterized protein LOC118193958 [Stegodyphus dumicola]|uniref:uncharacterized protein LOC118193958 n=1 Tax=Stegodyphus dumicola TaxID=202533 RepID=UPI0015ABF3E5|nr:uncharacterized protein LOC118193958 [Stegodyphus dumicola]
MGGLNCVPSADRNLPEHSRLTSSSSDVASFWKKCRSPENRKKFLVFASIFKTNCITILAIFIYYGRNMQHFYLVITLLMAFVVIALIFSIPVWKEICCKGRHAYKAYDDIWIRSESIAEMQLQDLDQSSEELHDYQESLQTSFMPEEPLAEDNTVDGSSKYDFRTFGKKVVEYQGLQETDV